MRYIIFMSVLFLLLVIATAVLYNMQLGSIPILLLAILLFYIGYRVLKNYE
ncbi:hypothetical protein HB943_03520 [Listeria weihenstephanensis]|uniref:Uncharacterized protein n=1 Tax=Listeria weihenstephanensis TaxID=1006155 RepID=A0A841Z307_9LIST|nr:hypothetical protein [Listeria weihenstephanensis]MBC1499660.1 hypothetical protein [Listeria weihenstephanensis]